MYRPNCRHRNAAAGRGAGIFRRCPVRTDGNEVQRALEGRHHRSMPLPAIAGCPVIRSISLIQAPHARGRAPAPPVLNAIGERERSDPAPGNRHDAEIRYMAGTYIGKSIVSHGSPKLVQLAVHYHDGNRNMNISAITMSGEIFHLRGLFPQ